MNTRYTRLNSPTVILDQARTVHVPSATKSARLEVSFDAEINENIKIILLYQMLSKPEFDQFIAVFVL